MAMPGASVGIMEQLLSGERSLESLEVAGTTQIDTLTESVRDPVRQLVSQSMEEQASFPGVDLPREDPPGNLLPMEQEQFLYSDSGCLKRPEQVNVPQPPGLEQQYHLGETSIDEADGGLFQWIHRHLNHEQAQNVSEATFVVYTTINILASKDCNMQQGQYLWWSEDKLQSGAPDWCQPSAQFKQIHVGTYGKDEVVQYRSLLGDNNLLFVDYSGDVPVLTILPESASTQCPKLLKDFYVGTPDPVKPNCKYLKIQHPVNKEWYYWLVNSDGIVVLETETIVYEKGINTAIFSMVQSC